MAFNRESQVRADLREGYLSVDNGLRFRTDFRGIIVKEDSVAEPTVSPAIDHRLCLAYGCRRLLGLLLKAWFRLPAGMDIGPLLLVRNDHDDHWLWEPAHDMKLTDFVDALARVNANFIRV